MTEEDNDNYRQAHVSLGSDIAVDPLGDRMINNDFPDYKWQKYVLSRIECVPLRY